MRTFFLVAPMSTVGYTITSIKKPYEVGFEVRVSNSRGTMQYAINELDNYKFYPISVLKMPESKYWQFVILNDDKYSIYDSVTQLTSPEDGFYGFHSAEEAYENAYDTIMRSYPDYKSNFDQHILLFIEKSDTNFYF